MVLKTERQSARMSKIKNDALDQYGAERFGRLIFVTTRRSVALKGLKVPDYKAVER